MSNRGTDDLNRCISDRCIGDSSLELPKRDQKVTMACAPREEDMSRPDVYSWSPDLISRELKEIKDVFVLKRKMTEKNLVAVMALFREWTYLLKKNGREILDQIGRTWLTQPQLKRSNVESRFKALEAAKEGKISLVFYYIGEEWRLTVARFFGGQGDVPVRRNWTETWKEFIYLKGKADLLTIELALGVAYALLGPP